MSRPYATAVMQFQRLHASVRVSLWLSLRAIKSLRVIKIHHTHSRDHALTHAHTYVALIVEIDLLLASLDAARWSLAGAEKDGRRRLREAVQIAQGVRAEIKDVEGTSAMYSTNDVLSHTRARQRRRRFSFSFFSSRPQSMFSLARWRRLVCPVVGGIRS